MPEFPDTRESLLARVKDPQDDDAWRSFVAVYRPVIYRLASGRGLQDADAQDSSQQVLASVAQAIRRWEPDAATGKDGIGERGSAKPGKTLSLGANEAQLPSIAKSVVQQSSGSV